MTRSIHILIILALLISAFFLTGCHRNEMVYTSPPSRTILLDSVKNESAVSHRLRDPDYFTVDFEVPAPDSCRVKIELRGNGTQLLRPLADSTFAPGPHTIQWNRKDKNGKVLVYGSYYYQFDVCGKTFTRSLHFRPQFKKD